MPGRAQKGACFKMNVEIEQGVIQPVADQKAGASSGLGSSVPVAGFASAAVGAPASSEMAALEAENEGLTAELRDARRQLSVSAMRLNRIVEAAHQLAYEHDWCSVFDDFCEEHGLPSRTRDYTVSVEVALRLELVQNARSADEAEELLDDVSLAVGDQVVSAIASLSRDELVAALADWNVLTVRDA